MSEVCQPRWTDYLEALIPEERTGLLVGGCPSPETPRCRPGSSGSPHADPLKRARQRRSTGAVSTRKPIALKGKSPVIDRRAVGQLLGLGSACGSAGYRFEGLPTYHPGAVLRPPARTPYKPSRRESTVATTR